MTDEAKRVVEALRHVGTSLTNDTLNCGACPMQDIPVAELDCGSKCPETLMHLAAELIEKLSAQLVNQATEYSQALKNTTEQRDTWQRRAEAAERDITPSCVYCKHSYLNRPGIGNCEYADAFECVGNARFEWRGLKEE